ncbi:hypothetical protein HN587_02710 [Candidatus Woesearchaeota archaeon]|mgnify:CR=1 FL=1|jgi:hypothetical protein|nr:hypothetical protein [Candidatus Woesearchaeota archaeon]
MTSLKIYPRISEILYYQYQELTDAKLRDEKKAKKIITDLTNIETKVEQTIFQQTRSRQLQKKFNQLLKVSQQYQNGTVSLEQTRGIFEELMQQKVMRQIQRYDEVKKELVNQGFDVDDKKKQGIFKDCYYVPTIKPLVVALNYLGFHQTMFSGKGNALFNPSVDFEGSVNLELLTEKVSDYNFKNQFRKNMGLWWTIQPSGLTKYIKLRKTSCEPFTLEEKKEFFYFVDKHSEGLDFQKIHSFDFKGNFIQASTDKNTETSTPEHIEIMTHLFEKIITKFPNYLAENTIYPQGLYSLSCKGFGLERKQADILPFAMYLADRLPAVKLDYDFERVIIT